jgi:outer membrane protein TolC
VRLAWRAWAASQRRANEAFIASRYDAQAACLLLESTAAKLYWEIAGLKTRIALSEANLADSRQIVALTRSRREAGAIDEQNLLQAERALLFKQNTLRQQQAWLVQQQNALSVLLDQAPGQPLPEIPPLVTRPVIPAIPTGLPSSLLARRPRWISSVRNFFPSLS